MGGAWETAGGKRVNSEGGCARESFLRVSVRAERRGPVVFAATGCRHNTWMRGADRDPGDRPSKFREPHFVMEISASALYA